MFVINGNFLASSQTNKIACSCNSCLHALQDISLTWPLNFVSDFIRNLQQIVVFTLGRSLQSNPPLNSLRSLEIFHSTADTPYYISRVVAYSDKPERLLWVSFILYPSEVQFQHLRTSTDKTPPRRSYQLVSMNFPSRLSPPRPGVPAGRRQPAPSFFLPADGAGSSQGEAEYPGRSTSGSNSKHKALCRLIEKLRQIKQLGSGTLKV